MNNIDETLLSEIIDIDLGSLSNNYEDVTILEKKIKDAQYTINDFLTTEFTNACTQESSLHSMGYIIELINFTIPFELLLLDKLKLNFPIPDGTYYDISDNISKNKIDLLSYIKDYIRLTVKREILFYNLMSIKKESNTFKKYTYYKDICELKFIIENLLTNS